MAKITLIFSSDELADEFIGWYLDGGGEDDFQDALSYRDVTVANTFCQITLEKPVVTYDKVITHVLVHP